MSQMDDLEVDESRRLTVFGKDLSLIPCFRNSWLYGLSSGVGTGLLHFLFTSKPRMSCHVGFSTTIGITLTYWFYCRYEWNRKTIELQKMQEYVEKRVLMEGTEMEKVHEPQIVDVSNTDKIDV